MNDELQRLHRHVAVTRPNQARRSWLGILTAALLLAASLLEPAAPAHAAGTITVSTTADEYGAGVACSLREAVRTANDGANFGGCALSGTQPFTISLPAGTFQLTIAGANNDNNASGDLDILVSGTALVGAGAASTIIQQTTADRVIDFNPTVASNFSGSLTNLRITGGNVGGTFGGGGIIYGDSNGGGTLTLNGVTVDGNTATQGPGGGIASGARGNLTIINSTISNNTASSPAPGGGASAGTGGGIDFLVQGPNQLTITNSTISGNRAAWTNDAGGGLHISGGTATIQRTHFVSNVASNGSFPTGLGGAIAHLDGTLTVSFSRFIFNAGVNGAAIWQSAGGGTTTANDNWWGASGGPAFMDLAGTPAPTATRWLQLRHSANPSSAPTNTSTTLTADLFGLNTGGSTAAGNLAGLPSFFSQPASVIFDNPVLGTLSGAATQFTNGAATATYTAGATLGSGSANATADSETVLTFINIPLAVLLAGFSAQGQADQVLVQWDTVSEMGNMGFNLWRGVSPDGPGAQLNTSLIPSQSPGSTQGYSYQWIDQADLVPGATYYYWLEDIDLNGVVTRHGPVSATLAAPTAVTLGGLSASPGAAASLSWGLPALVTALSAAAALAWRRR